MMRWLVPFPIIPLVSLSWVEGQPSTPAQNVRLPQAIYSPQPIYRAEWVNQSLASKGIVLVKIDPKTGVVTGTGMLQSTGSKLLDRAALKAYSKWRFKPGSVPQVKIPIEFASRPICVNATARVMATLSVARSWNRSWALAMPLS